MDYDGLAPWLVRENYKYDVRASDNCFAAAVANFYGLQQRTGHRNDAPVEIIEDPARGYVYLYSLPTSISMGVDRYALWRPHRGKPYRPWRVYAHPNNAHVMPKPSC